MDTRWMLRAAATISIALGGALSACGGPVEPEEELSQSEAKLEESSLSEPGKSRIPPPEDCPPNLPPCECELAGTYACRDGDGDGWVNLDDNCDSTYNPDQANCDNDGYGDACDSVSGTQTRSRYSVYQYSYYGGWDQCYWNQLYYQMYMVYDEYERVTTSYCAGPNAGQTTTTNTYLRSFTAMCFQYGGYCPVNNTSYMPQPWCG